MEAIVLGLLIPLIGTAAGAACVFFLKKDLKADVQRALTGFAAGVMVAASIWSLIVPAIEQSAEKGRWASRKTICRFVWNMDGEKNLRYLELVSAERLLHTAL